MLHYCTILPLYPVVIFKSLISYAYNFRIEDRIMKLCLLKTCFLSYNGQGSSISLAAPQGGFSLLEI